MVWWHRKQNHLFHIKVRNKEIWTLEKIISKTLFKLQQSFAHGLQKERKYFQPEVLSADFFLPPSLPPSLSFFLSFFLSLSLSLCMSSVCRSFSLFLLSLSLSPLVLSLHCGWQQSQPECDKENKIRLVSDSIEAITTLFKLPGICR